MNVLKISHILHHCIFHWQLHEFMIRHISNVYNVQSYKLLFFFHSKSNIMKKFNYAIYLQGPPQNIRHRGCSVLQGMHHMTIPSHEQIGRYKYSDVHVDL